MYRRKTTTVEGELNKAVAGRGELQSKVLIKVIKGYLFYFSN